jgi:hypothetical protein
MPRIVLTLPLLLAAMLAQVSNDVHAQQPAFDPGRGQANVIAGVGGDLLARAPDAAIDSLFQAVAGAARVPQEAAVLCELFDPDATRDVEALQQASGRLGPASRERFAGAFLAIALGGLQGEPVAHDPAAARQVLKSAAVKAGFLHDGFAANLGAAGDDARSRDARCLAFRQLVGVLGLEPLPARAAATRWLLAQGLDLAIAMR